MRVFDAVSTPNGLNAWWTQTATGVPAVGAPFELGFGAGYHWRAVVTKAFAPVSFELQLTSSDADWDNTLVGFDLAPHETGTWVQFYHKGWPASNPHYRISSHCWALYLRVLRRHLEAGETVPYERRLQV